MHAARDAGEIDGWFFVRYVDDHGLRPHLRLRVHSAADDRAPLDAFAARLDDALGARARGRPGGAGRERSLSPRGRALRRRARRMTIAWRVFTLDSELACGLLAAEGD